MGYLKIWGTKMERKKQIEMNNIYVYIQLILFIALSILLFMTVFIDLMPVVQIVMGILLFVIAYNNFYLINKKIGYLIAYILFGIGSIILGILGMI